MAVARIYQRPKNAMQSGRARTQEWVVEFAQTEPQEPDPLTGWAGHANTTSQVRMRFPTLEAAKDYAQREGHDYHVIPTPERKLKLQAYADNFR
ncbi:ETC complex I subunit [Stakelama pacifica]|uniref:ETC complex I subunit-like protein n=1 Tax=Stakelama pacifica TaxID=517720 RepID=A0A4R6FXA0_9SPHN|nr:ETC complex I subunit [Stakelama pacifica]TDN85684.1 ETC complex I subunit-like protein [Stakelama pacifica]GGO91936.1 NADH-ubiquinone oxidoreductase [Stakelama pacifica]